MDDIWKSVALLSLILSSILLIGYFALLPLRSRGLLNRWESAAAAFVYTVVACAVMHTSCVSETGHSPLDLVYYFGIKQLPAKAAQAPAH